MLMKNRFAQASKSDTSQYLVYQQQNKRKALQMTSFLPKFIRVIRILSIIFFFMIFFTAVALAFLQP